MLHFLIGRIAGFHTDDPRQSHDSKGEIHAADKDKTSISFQDVLLKGEAGQKSAETASSEYPDQGTGSLPEQAESAESMLSRADEDAEEVHSSESLETSTEKPNALTLEEGESFLKPAVAGVLQATVAPSPRITGNSAAMPDHPISRAEMLILPSHVAPIPSVGEQSEADSRVDPVPENTAEPLQAHTTASPHQASESPLRSMHLAVTSPVLGGSATSLILEEGEVVALPPMGGKIQRPNDEAAGPVMAKTMLSEGQPVQADQPSGPSHGRLTGGPIAITAGSGQTSETQVTTPHGLGVPSDSGLARATGTTELFVQSAPVADPPLGTRAVVPPAMVDQFAKAAAQTLRVGTPAASPQRHEVEDRVTLPTVPAGPVDASKPLNQGLGSRRIVAPVSEPTSAQITSRSQGVVFGVSSLSALPSHALAPPPALIMSTADLANARAEAEFVDLPELRLVSEGGSSNKSQLGAPVLRAELPRHISLQIAETFQRVGNRPVDLTLNPVELGRVRINLQTADGTVIVHVAAERPETLDLMRRHVNILAQEFHAIGYGEAKFSFAGQGSGDQRDQKSPPDELRDGETSEATEHLAAPSSEAASMILSDRVDIRV